MKVILILLFSAAAAVCLGGSPSTTNPTTEPVALRCRIALPERGVVQLGPGRVPLHVVLENMSGSPLAIADEWNSWGYFSLTLRYTTADGKTGTVEKVGRDWDKNYLTATTIPPGGLLVRDVAFDPADWTGLPAAGIVDVIAVFKQDSDNAAEDRKAGPMWSGSVESPAVRFEVRKPQ